MHGVLLVATPPPDLSAIKTSILVSLRADGLGLRLAPIQVRLRMPAGRVISSSALTAVIQQCHRKSGLRGIHGIHGT